VKHSIILFISLIFLVSLSSEERWQYTDYDTVDHTSFREYTIFNRPIDFDDIDYPLLHASILFITNEMRIQYKLPALPFALELERSAFNHSKNMVQYKFFSHTDPHNSNRSRTEDRARLAGISNPYLAENIAESFAIQYKAGVSVSPIDSQQGTFSYSRGGSQIPNLTYLSAGEAVIKQWMNSPGHRANILSVKALSIGCGAFFYHDSSFYNMPKFKMTQNFQWFKKIITSPDEPTDLAPGETDSASNKKLQKNENSETVTNPFY